MSIIFTTAEAHDCKGEDDGKMLASVAMEWSFGFRKFCFGDEKLRKLRMIVDEISRY